MASQMCRNARRWYKNALTSLTCLSIERRLWSMTPNSLTWSARWTTEPTTLTMTSVKVWERCRLPKRTDSDLSGLRWIEGITNCSSTRRAGRWGNLQDGGFDQGSWIEREREMQSCVSSAYCCWGNEKEEAREAIDAEKKTENRTLGSSSGKMSRRRRVVTNDDRLGAISNIGLNPVIDYSIETKTGITI